jgi:hypothetical protein
MQRRLGRTGLADFRPPFESYMLRNYALLVNTLPRIRSGQATINEIAGCEEAIMVKS